MKILLLEDEEKLANFMKGILEQEKHDVTMFDSIEGAMKNGHVENYDLMILDLMLGGKSGDFLLRSVRKAGLNIPVIVVSALGQVNKKIEILNLGADDYLTKPFDPDELIARINALYRRHLEAKHKDQKKYGDVVLYHKQHKIRRGDKDIMLTKKEFEILRLLIQHENQAVRTEDLLAKVWQAKLGYHSNVIQATIRRLRRKVDEGYPHKIIHSVHGVGYMFVPPEEPKKKK